VKAENVYWDNNNNSNDLKEKIVFQTLLKDSISLSGEKGEKPLWYHNECWDGKYLSLRKFVRV
jgi:hypothetical protein